MENLQVSPAEQPKKIITIGAGIVLGLYFARNKDNTTQLIYGAVGFLAGYALYKSFLATPPKVVTENTTENTENTITDPYPPYMLATNKVECNDGTFDVANGVIAPCINHGGVKQTT